MAIVVSSGPPDTNDQVIKKFKRQKHIFNEVLRLTVPAHKPIKRSTLPHILKQARLSLEQFQRNL